MSRFWGGDSSDEDDEKKLSEVEDDDDIDSDDDSDDDDDEEDGDDEEKEDKEKPDIFQRFLSDDEDEEETKRTVKTQKAKRDDLMTRSISSLKGYLEERNWGSIQTEFENLVKIITKFQNVSKVPKRFIKIFATVEDAIDQDWEDKELRKSMKQPVQKALTTMKQKIKKLHSSYEKELEEYREKKYDSDVSLQEADAEEEEEEQKEEVIKPEDVQRKLEEIIANRGRKNIDRKKILEMLEKLFEISDSSIEKIKIKIIHVTAYLDQSVSLSTYMNFENWNKACELIHQLIDMLNANPNVIVKPLDEEKEEDGKVYISGSIDSLIERLDEEFTKSLQQIDPHTSDYIQRLRDESKLYYLIIRVQNYYESINEVESVCRCIVKRVEHIYYKNDAVITNLESQTIEKLTGKAPEKVDPSALINKLCTYLYQHATDRVRPRALMFHVYHHAHSGRFAKARDLLLMSHIQESIQQADISTQILFNRTMAQIGLCAFRSGMIKEAQSSLYELESSGRAKELLAQGIMTQKFVEKSSEQERLEKLRQVPFHMHINLELLECIFLTCSMILEVPMMSINYESKKSLISKPFKRLLEFSERQDFLGPPENTREHIVQATKALSNGDWEKCVDFIHKIKIWDLMSDVQEIKKMLSSKIQYSGLQTYLLAFSSFYDTLSLDHLSTVFKLSRQAVQSTISKMIINEELHASLDQVAGVVILHRVEPTRLQQQALQFADQLSNYMENSERFLSYPYSKDDKLSQKRTTRPTGRFSTNPQRKNTNYRKQEETQA